MNYPNRPTPARDDGRRFPSRIHPRVHVPIILEGEVVVIPPSAPLIRTPWLFLLVFLLVVLTSVFLAFRLGNRQLAEARLYVLSNPVPNVESVTEGDASVRREIDMLKSRLLSKRTLDRIGIEALYPDIGSLIQGGRLPLWVELSRKMKTRLFRGPSPESPEALADERRQWLLDTALRRFRGALTVRQEGASAFITLGYRHDDRDMTVAVLGEFLKVYQEARQRLYAPRQARTLQVKLELQRSRLETLDSRIAAVVRKSSQQKRAHATAAQIARGDELANKIRETQQALARLEKKLESRRGGAKQVNPPKPRVTPPPTPLDPVVLAGMRETLLNLEKTREQILAAPHTTRKDLVVIDDKIKSLKNFLSRRQPVGPSVEPVDAETQRLQREITALRGQLEALNQARDTESGQLQLEFAALWQQLEGMQKEQNALEAHLALTAQQTRQLDALRREREAVAQTHTALLAQWNEIERINRVRRQALESVRVLQAPLDVGADTRWTLLFSLLSVPLGLLMAVLIDRLPWRR